jgi:Rad3-related DNA helicase
MAYATVEEAEVRIAELEKENRNLTRESVSRKDAFQKLEAKQNKLLEDLKAAGIENIEGNIGEQIANASGKTEIEKTLKNLEKRLKTAEETTTALTAEKDKLTKETTHAKLAGVLKESMKDIIGADDTIESLILRERIKINKDGKIVYIDEDGDEVAVDKFVEKFKKTNPDRVKVVQNPGSGGAGGGGGGQGKGKSIPQSEYLKLSGEGKTKFYAEGGHVEG